MPKCNPVCIYLWKVAVLIILSLVTIASIVFLTLSFFPSTSYLQVFDLYIRLDELRLPLGIVIGVTFVSMMLWCCCCFNHFPVELHTDNHVCRLARPHLTEEEKRRWELLNHKERALLARSVLYREQGIQDKFSVTPWHGNDIEHGRRDESL